MHSAIRNPKKAICWLGIFSLVGYLILTWLSWRFTEETPDDAKPTLWVLVGFAFEFLAYWGALALVLRLPPSRCWLGGIVGGACLFRLVMLPSVPIHEIDIYRYIWDGAVFAEGVSPYRYSPQQVLDATHMPPAELDQDLRRLVTLQARSKSLAYSLERIHYGVLPSPYPSVSQAVFALSAIGTPERASPHFRMVVMKLLLVLFDLATLWVLIALLKNTGLHPGWSLAYGWCPLLLKEIANGGHLDSIVIFFTTLAIWLLVRSCLVDASQRTASRLASAGLVGSIIALAIGAKIYPVLLLPWFAALWWRRCGGLAAAVGLMTTAVVALGMLYPLIPNATDQPSLEKVASPTPTVPPLYVPGQPATSIPEPLNLSTPSDTSDPAAGLLEFFKRWEMNDLIFMVVLENLRPQAGVEPSAKPWFVIVPDAWTQAVANSSFLVARAITGGMFGLLACWLAWRAAGQDDPQAWCRAAMLTLAWFWFTCPTQNPWYWCWVLPLLPFARYRTWHVIGACSLLYYLRFWLMAHYPTPPVLGTPYNGEIFFYFVVTWVEFAPCLLALGLEWSQFCWKKSSVSEGAGRK